LLAFIRIYEIDRKEEWLDAAEKAAEYLINIRDGGLLLSELGHDHRLLQALNELHRYRPKPLYLNHALRIARAIMLKQKKKSSTPDWRGSYLSPPRSLSTAVRSNGLYAAYLLAKDFTSLEEAVEISEAIKLGVRFQLQTQFRPESVLYLKHPQRSLGGFHKNLTDYELRVDYTQHNISSLIGLYQIEESSGD